MNDLTKKYSLVEDTNANLRSENIKLQESFTSLQAIHKALEGIGSRYMSKFGFEKGKDLGKNEQGIPQSIPYVKNNKTAALGANGGLVNMTTPIRKGEKKNQASSHVKFIKRGTTCDEGAKIGASSSKQDKFKTSSKSQTQEPSSHVSFYVDFVLTRCKHLGPQGMFR